MWWINNQRPGLPRRVLPVLLAGFGKRARTEQMYDEFPGSGEPDDHLLYEHFAAYNVLRLGMRETTGC